MEKLGLGEREEAKKSEERVGGETEGFRFRFRRLGFLGDPFLLWKKGMPTS